MIHFQELDGQIDGKGRNLGFVPLNIDNYIYVRQVSCNFCDAVRAAIAEWTRQFGRATKVSHHCRDFVTIGCHHHSAWPFRQGRLFICVLKERFSRICQKQFSWKPSRCKTSWNNNDRATWNAPLVRRSRHSLPRLNIC